MATAACGLASNFWHLFLARIGVGLLAHLIHDLVALAGDHVMHGATTEFLAQAGVDRLIQASPGPCLITTDRDVIELGIDDAPLDVGVDEHVLLLGRDEAFRLSVVQRDDALLEIAHVLHQRHLEIKAGLGQHPLHFAQLEDERVLALIDGKDGHRQHHQDGADDETQDIDPLAHQRPSRSRERSEPSRPLEEEYEPPTLGALSICGGTSPDKA